MPGRLVLAIVTAGALAATAALIVSQMTEQGRSVVPASLFAFPVALPAGAALLYAFAWQRWMRRQHNRTGVQVSDFFSKSNTEGDAYVALRRLQHF